MSENVVNDFLSTFGRTEDELFEGEEEYIQFGHGDYNSDRHYAFEIKKEECALIVVDLQNDFVAPNSPIWIPEALRQIPRNKRLIEAARRHGVPVIYTAHTINADCGADFFEYWAPIREGAIKEGSKGADIYPEIYPEEGERVVDTKHAYDAFAGTDLDYVLRNHRTKTCVVSGTVTNFCVESTARTAYFNNYHVVLVEDCVSSDNPYAHEATIRTLRRGFARVLKSDELIDIWAEGDQLYAEAKKAQKT
ncbi:MAG: cysteine hydrolase family protein [Nitrospinota bacterium]